MRQPPSPLLLSARKRRPRRTPPRGAQQGETAPATPAEFASTEGNNPASDTERCALVQPFPEVPGAHGRGRADTDPDPDDTPFE